jgi:hypothetical protein
MTAIVGSAPVMTFKTAYAQRTSTDADKLQLYVSSNCGVSWALRKSMTGASLISGGIVTSSFVPTAAQWTTQTANLSGFATQPNLYYMFRFTSNGGNNIYIDDINIYGTSATGIDDIESATGFNMYPNPIDESTVVSFTLDSKKNTDIRVLDVIGREVAIVFSGSLNEGDHQFAVGEQSHLSKGIYFVKVSMDEKSFTKKMIVQ